MTPSLRAIENVFSDHIVGYTIPVAHSPLRRVRLTNAVIDECHSRSTAATCRPRGECERGASSARSNMIGPAVTAYPLGDARHIRPVGETGGVPKPRARTDRTGVPGEHGQRSVPMGFDQRACRYA